MENTNQAETKNTSVKYTQYCEVELLSPGDKAPDFSLPATPDQKLSLSDFKGRAVVLVMYPSDWSPICGDQLTLYNEILSEFKEYDAQLIGISVDNAWCHLAFAKDRKLHFPLLSDFEPKGAVARMYGAYDNNMGLCTRSLFVINPEGNIHWSYKSPVGVNPGADGILDALESMNKKQIEESLQ